MLFYSITLLHYQKFQPCCLNDLVSDLTEEMSELATASDIHLTSQVPFIEIYVLGNESQLYRLVLNLISNAIQYIPAQGDVHIRGQRTKQINVYAKYKNLVDMNVKCTMILAKVLAMKSG